MTLNLFKKLVLPVAVVILIVLLVTQLNQKPRAPDITFTTITGEQINMASLKGKVVLVNFWATDCPGCIKEMPALIQTYQEYKNKGFEIIAVAMPFDPPAQVKNYVTMQQLPFKVMHDGLGEVTYAFGQVSLTPTAFIYDTQGQLLRHTIGELNFIELKKLLDKALAV